MNIFLNVLFCIEYYKFIIGGVSIIFRIDIIILILEVKKMVFVDVR